MFFCNNGVINEIQKANLTWEIHWYAIYFFGKIETEVNLKNGTGPKSALGYIHTSIGANIALSLQYVLTHIYEPTQTTKLLWVSGEQGGKPRNIE